MGKLYGLVALTLLFIGPTGESLASDTLVITGSSTMAPMILEIGKRFESQHPGVKVNVQTGGSSRGVADVRKGLADIGMASRALKESESALTSHLVALDGIGIILNEKNPIKKLTRSQVIGIYKGEIRNWKEVGGVDAPITVVNKAQGRSTLELFLAYYELSPLEVKAHIVIGDNQQGIKTVAGSSKAIGYVSIGAAEFSIVHGSEIKLLPVGEVDATMANVKKGTYPLSRPLNLVTKAKNPKGLAKEFLDFAQSKATHDLISQQYYVPISL